MKISIFKKDKAPSRFLVRKGLEWGDSTRLGTSRRLSAEEVISAPENQEQADARHDAIEHLVAVVLPETASDQVADDETCAHRGEIHLQPPKVLCSLRHYYRRDYQFLAILITLPI